MKESMIQLNVRGYDFRAAKEKLLRNLL